MEDLVDSGCNVLTYDYGKVFTQATKNVILNFISLREEKRIQNSTKTRFLFKLESDATVKILIQWINYISRDCINSMSEYLDENSSGENSNFNVLLPNHEQIFDLTQLNNGKTLSRVIFYLIYCGIQIKDDYVSSPNDGSDIVDNGNNSNNNNSSSNSSSSINDDTDKKNDKNNDIGNDNSHKSNDNNNNEYHKNNNNIVNDNNNENNYNNNNNNTSPTSQDLNPSASSNSNSPSKMIKTNSNLLINATSTSRRNSFQNVISNPIRKKSLNNPIKDPLRFVTNLRNHINNESGFNKIHILSLKKAENNPILLLELSTRYASEFLGLPVYNSQDIIDCKKMETVTFLGHLFISSSPTLDNNNIDMIKQLLLQYKHQKSNLIDLHGRLIYSTRCINSIEDSFKEYSLCPFREHSLHNMINSKEYVTLLRKNKEIVKELKNKKILKEWNVPSVPVGVTYDEMKIVDSGSSVNILDENDTVHDGNVSLSMGRNDDIVHNDNNDNSSNTIIIIIIIMIIVITITIMIIIIIILIIIVIIIIIIIIMIIMIIALVFIFSSTSLTLIFVFHTSFVRSLFIFHFSFFVAFFYFLFFHFCLKHFNFNFYLYFCFVSFSFILFYFILFYLFIFYFEYLYKRRKMNMRIRMKENWILN